MKIVVLGLLLVGNAAIHRAEATQATNRDERAVQRVGTLAKSSSSSYSARANTAASRKRRMATRA